MVEVDPSHSTDGSECLAPSLASFDGYVGSGASPKSNCPQVDVPETANDVVAVDVPRFVGSESVTVYSPGVFNTGSNFVGP